MSSINTAMPRISRHRDRCFTGHGCTGSAPVNTTQYSVFANGKPILRTGDPVQPHTLPVGPFCKFHKARINRGSRRVFVRGIGVGRRGDSTDFGFMTGASPNVFAG